MNQKITNEKEACLNSGKLTRTDYICMSVLALLFTVIAFFRLGNTYAPSSSYMTDTVNRDIVLDFGEYTDIGSFSIFLVNLYPRHFYLCIQ